MLIPQFSLRLILAVTAVCAVISLIAAFALRGAPWAAALTLGITSLVVVLAAHGAMFFAVWLCSLVLPRRGSWPAAVRQSPFGD